MIKYNNSLYSPNPPSIIIQPLTPQEFEDEKIRNRLDEQNILFNGFIDIEEVRNRELIEWEEPKN